MVYFIGAGCGASDLITLRGRKLLDSADVIVYAGSLVNPELLNGIREKTELYNSAFMDLDQVMEIMVRAHDAGKTVARLHTGDPSVYGAVREQMDRLEARGIPFEVCPGVSSFSGAAASLKAEYTLPGVSQTLILTRMEGRTPVPDREAVRSLAAHGASMAIFLSASMTDKLQEELLRSGGYRPDTPCAVVYKATWPEERILRMRLDCLSEETQRAGIRKTALILVGDFLGDEYELSRLYDRHFETEFRPAAVRPEAAADSGLSGADPVTGNRPASGYGGAGKGRQVFRRTALCFTDRGEELGRSLDGVRILRHGRDFRDTAAMTEELFETEDAILFLSAAGIAVRSIAGCARDKRTDPAVLVIDDHGRFVIPVLSGHLGGANELARELSAKTGAQAVITTASDGQEMESVDMWAKRCGYYIHDMAAAKVLTAAMLQGRAVSIKRTPAPGARESGDIVISADSPAAALTLTPKTYVIGVGCRKGTDPQALLAFAEEKLAERGIPGELVRAVCSIEEKAEEPAIHRLARRFGCPYFVFTAEQLESLPGDFTGSEFVKKTVGTDNVCERSAAAGCGGRCDGFELRKTAGQGMTIAVARYIPDPDLPAFGADDCSG